MNDFTALDPIIGLTGHFVHICGHSLSAASWQHSRAEERAVWWTCSQGGRPHAAPSQTDTNAQQSPLPSLDVEVRPLDQPILTWAVAGTPGLFFLSIFYNTVQPNLPSKASSVSLMENFLPWTLSPAGRRNGEGKSIRSFQATGWLTLGWAKVCTFASCMTQVPSGPFLYGMYTVYVWVEALPDIKWRIWRNNAFSLSLSCNHTESLRDGFLLILRHMNLSRLLASLFPALKRISLRSLSSLP